VNGTVQFLIGTIAHWAGWIFLLRGVYGLFQAVRGQRDLKKALVDGAIGVLGFGVSLGLDPQAGKVVLPLLWPDMPAIGWLTLFATGMLTAQGIGALSAISAEERTAKLKGMGIWLAVAVATVVWIVQFKHPVKLLEGRIAMSWAGFGILLAAAVATTAVIGVVSRSAPSVERVRGIATQLALFVGAIVFLVPFVWLLVTSLKEDRDITTAQGLVWLPRRSLTVPYLSEQNPLYEATFNGQRVQAVVDAKKSDSEWLLRVTRPLNVSGYTFYASPNQVKRIPNDVPVVTVDWDGQPVTGKVVREEADGQRTVEVMQPESLAGQRRTYAAAAVEPVRPIGIRWENYRDALEFLPRETNNGLLYLRNTMVIVVGSVLGTLLSCSLVAYGFARLRFPGREFLFKVLLSTMMLPAAVTLLPQFLIFRSIGWVDTLYPLWVPAFFASAFNVFLLREFFKQIPYELEDAAKIDGCSYLRTFWSVLLPQVKPALIVVAIWTFMGAWNNFMGPLIYVNSQEQMPIAYALQLFNNDRGGEPALLMAFSTMAILPVLAVFAVAQKYFIEGVSLSGLGGR